MKAITKGVVFFVMIFSMPIFATDIPKAYIKVANELNLPAPILFAVAVTESRDLTIRSRLRAWPWTLTINKKPFYYDNQSEFCSAIKEQLALEQLPSQFGIGVMQIEYKWHKARFTKDSICDPYENLRIGGQILLEYTKSTGGLWSGIGRYHSGTVEKSEEYRNRVSKVLINEVLK